MLYVPSKVLYVVILKSDMYFVIIYSILENLNKMGINIDDIRQKAKDSIDKIKISHTIKRTMIKR